MVNRGAYAGGGGGRRGRNCPSYCIISIVPSSEGAFSWVVDSLVPENFPGDTPLDPQIPTVLLADQHIKQLFFWKRVLESIIYLCGGAYKFIDVPSEEAFPPLP